MSPIAHSVARDRICDAVRHGCQRAYSSGLRAVVLTGSLARGEASVVERASGWDLLGDAEFMLVFERDVPLPTDAQVRALCMEIEADLAQGGTAAPLSIAAVPEAYLQRLRPHIFAYELSAWGEVISGDPDVLRLIPAFSPSDIPLEDGWRLLCNRLVEHLEALGRRSKAPSDHVDELRYRTVKLYLDMATSLLLFLGAYEADYRSRARRLEELAHSDLDPAELPFPLAEFAAGVADCTRWKLDAARESGLPWMNSQAAVSLARRLWRWELERMAGVDTSVSDERLWERWMRQQRLWTRARGWLHVARAQGWHRGWRDWPRWMRLAWRASPRYCVYAVATQLLFAAVESGPEGNGRAAQACPARALRLLPLTLDRNDAHDAGSWGSAIEAVAWNYHRFLVPTRS